MTSSDWHSGDARAAADTNQADLLASPAPPAVTAQGARLEIDGERVRNGLAQLVLTLVKLLHELLERQAIARMDSGSLTDEEIERLGTTLMRQAEELRRVQEVFGLEDEDLNIDLGPLGRLL
ncbi:MAG: gas vesicle protein K [Thiohalocapsa sp.]|jgi:hypothetical protein|uniref:gas vesicle protein K n=1 Tax=Thiohalocapsa sp. TaxID=2497641 RepID=UPI0025CC33A3|nr:gas vesicle protein K [Thiohalocapsa sp.]MCG6941180.1 gas vesicle protein K [Thiohalocapsa sp.]